MPNYRYSLQAISSKPDVAGESLWAFIYTDSETSRVVRGTISGGESNVYSIPYFLNGGSHEPHDYLYTSVKLPIRKFDKMVKGWEYAGCRPEDLAAYITHKMTIGTP